MATAAEYDRQDPWYLKPNVPVLFPTHDAFDLSLPRSVFDALIRDIVHPRDGPQRDDAGVLNAKERDGDDDDDITLVSAATREMRSTLAHLDLESSTTEGDKPGESQHPFIKGLLSHDRRIIPMPEEDVENRMFTENADVAYRSTTSPLVDLFAELEDVISGPRLLELLNAAWAEDPLATLKIIFNARSIHLGKASRITFYRCAGWLAQHHPLTLIANLRWLSRPVIQKKVAKKEEADSDMVMVDVKPEKDEDDVTKFDVKHGVAHGYWKDILNILVLGVRGYLDVLAQPRDILNVERQEKHFSGNVSPEEARTRRRGTRDKRNSEAAALFNSDPVYRGLHLTVARLFAEQLETDLALLRGADPKAKQDISLCAKWAPSHNRFHDKHTFVVSGIAELLHPAAGVCAARGVGAADRELYLRHARELYRRDVSALRAHLDVVERKLSARSYGSIRYDRVPSLAMNNYAEIFARRDPDRFEAYLDSVAEGKARISGATLLPSTLVSQARGGGGGGAYSYARAPAEEKMRELRLKVVDRQWQALVQRVRDSGTLASSIAVCDVSGSMYHPVFRDGTCPLDSAVGLSLLLAEVTAPPFGGHFITFSATPAVESVDLAGPLRDNIAHMSRSRWGMNTDLVAVFEDLILPAALRNELSQEDMVKRVFVFSDMQFDSAEMRPASRPGGGFGSSFERIKSKYADAGYEMPELVFWNLAGGRAGYHGQGMGGDPVAPKAVTAEETGTTIVSGYSQAMLKVFLDNGTFDDPNDEEENLKMTEEDGDTVVVDSETPTKKQKMDPLSTVRKAIGHKAYDPLVVMD